LAASARARGFAGASAGGGRVCESGVRKALATAAGLAIGVHRRAARRGQIVPMRAHAAADRFAGAEHGLADLDRAQGQRVALAGRNQLRALRMRRARDCQ